MRSGPRAPGTRIPLRRNGFRPELCPLCPEICNISTQNVATGRKRDDPGSVDRYGSAGRSLAHTTDTSQSISETPGTTWCLCPVMSESAGQIPLFPIPPGWCGLRVPHVFHRYLAVELGQVFHCRGTARPGLGVKHVRRRPPERRGATRSPGAPLPLPLDPP